MVAWRTLFVLKGAVQIEIACLMHRTRKHIIPAHYQAALDCLAALIGRAQVVEVELSQVRFSPPISSLHARSRCLYTLHTRVQGT